MAICPTARNRGIMIIVFSITQWLFMFMRYILANNLFALDTNERILYFCVSSIGGAFVIFVGLIYMVLKGNSDRE
ncbi:hypothetical protein [Acinetobacter sp. ANC 4862]|uniref:hypothetical protein n=1 Tax=Acinetobacter sp. ANC 4862 TaxID=2529849 RepID=UPI00103DC017|nr:hypothetical protein [Acinetobacter sp. ANC 4862]TCH64500.1 hypothetical protein E0409_05385 [Acinetobacter sp. ANC 4862]